VNRTRTTLALLAPLGGIAGLIGLSACPSTATTSLYTPITGLIIDSSSLLAGIGCGTAPGQVYKYAAVATLAGDASQNVSGLPVSGVFDCFTNGQLANLPTPDGGNFDFVIAIYAWNEASFPPALGNCDNLPSDAACPGEDPGLVLHYAPTANWTTTCTTQQVQGVSGVAVCGSLVPALDAGDASAGDANLGSDEGADAAEGDGGDGSPGAGDSGGVEAGEGDSGAAEGGAPAEAGPIDGGDAGSAAAADGGDSG
jgi:hypothetical protein